MTKPLKITVKGFIPAGYDVKCIPVYKKSGGLTKTLKEIKILINPKKKK